MTEAAADSSNVKFQAVAANDALLFHWLGLVVGRRASFDHTGSAVNEAWNVKPSTTLRAIGSGQRRAAVLSIFQMRTNSQILAPVVQSIMIQMVRLKSVGAVGNESVQPNGLSAAGAFANGRTHIKRSFSLGLSCAPCPRVLNHFLQSFGVNQGVQTFSFGDRFLTPKPTVPPQLNCEMVPSIVPAIAHEKTEYGAQKGLSAVLISRFGTPRLMPTYCGLPIIATGRSRFGDFSTTYGSVAAATQRYPLGFWLGSFGLADNSIKSSLFNTVDIITVTGSGAGEKHL